jgi:hypothetical protein
VPFLTDVGGFGATLKDPTLPLEFRVEGFDTIVAGFAEREVEPVLTEPILRTMVDNMQCILIRLWKKKVRF